MQLIVMNAGCGVLLQPGFLVVGVAMGLDGMGQPREWRHRTTLVLNKVS